MNKQSGPVDERREAVARIIGSFVVYDDRGGPDTEVLIDRMGVGDEAERLLYELTDQVLALFATPSLLPEGGFGSSWDQSVRGGTGAGWQDIATAPKDRNILVWHEHESDPYVEEEATGRLTVYGAHAEGLSRSPDGAYMARWGGELDDADDGYIPNWWFVADGDWERPLAPTHWQECRRPTPAADAAPLAAGPEASQLGDSGSPSIPTQEWGELEPAAVAEALATLNPPTILRLIAERTALEEERDECSADAAAAREELAGRDEWHAIELKAAEEKVRALEEERDDLTWRLRIAQERADSPMPLRSLLAAEDKVRALEERVRVAEEALERIERWFGEFPDTGRKWDDGSPMSYATCFGSNGERDFMRGIARQALAQLSASLLGAEEGASQGKHQPPRAAPKSGAVTEHGDEL